MEKLVKTRKEHNCYLCGKNISTGSLSHFYKLKSPKFNDNDCQIGIEYTSFYICENFKCQEVS